MMDLIVPLLTAFGLGSIVTAFVQAWLTRHDRREARKFEERKAAYIGLLEALHRAEITKAHEQAIAAKNFGHWAMRCEIVAPKEVRDAIRRLFDTEPNSEGRTAALELLKTALRRDLGVSI